MRTRLQRLKEKISSGEVTILTQKTSEGAMIGDAFAAAGFSSFEFICCRRERSAHWRRFFSILRILKRQLECGGVADQLYYPIAMLHLACFSPRFLSSRSVWTQVEIRWWILRDFYGIGSVSFISFGHVGMRRRNVSGSGCDHWRALNAACALLDHGPEA